MSQRRILIVRQDRIGDVVLSTPIPREIKKAYPNSFVAVLVRSYTKDIYLNNPNVDEIIVADELLEGTKKTFWKWIKIIRSFKFTHALMLLPNEKINYLLFFAGIKTRIGVGYKFYQFITGVKSVSRHKYIPLRHEADYSMDLARRIGIESSNISPEIFLSENEKNAAAQYRKQMLNGYKYFVGIHTGSGNSAPNWRAESYFTFAEALNKNENIKIVITDFDVPKIFSGSSFEFLSKRTTLREDIIRFSALDLLVSSSTGPMHICSALKVKTLSLFCPLNACSPILWGPLGNESEIILPSENYCQTKCPGNPKICNFEGNGGIEPKQAADLLETKYFSK
jgi:heptosyltransferase-2